MYSIRFAFRFISQLVNISKQFARRLIQTIRINYYLYKYARNNYYVSWRFSFLRGVIVSFDLSQFIKNGIARYYDVSVFQEVDVDLLGIHMTLPLFYDRYDDYKSVEDVKLDYVCIARASNVQRKWVFLDKRKQFLDERIRDKQARRLLELPIYRSQQQTTREQYYQFANRLIFTVNDHLIMSIEPYGDTLELKDDIVERGIPNQSETSWFSSDAIRPVNAIHRETLIHELRQIARFGLIRLNRFSYPTFFLSESFIAKPVIRSVVYTSVVSSYSKNGKGNEKRFGSLLEVSLYYQEKGFVRTRFRPNVKGVFGYTILKFDLPCTQEDLV